MQKRYTVFVAHVEAALPDATEAAVQTILGRGHIPVEMSQFPASGRASFDYIRGLLDQTDYMIVILAGLFGSGFVRREVDYALKSGIPVVAFLHDDPDALPMDQRETDPQQMRRLDRLRAKLSKSAYARWTTTADLVQKLGASLESVIAETPRRGWIPDVVAPGQKVADIPDSLREAYLWAFVEAFHPVEFYDQNGTLMEDVRFDIFLQIILWVILNPEKNPEEIHEASHASPAYLYYRFYQYLLRSNFTHDELHWPIEDFLNKFTALKCLGLLSGRYATEVTDLGRTALGRYPADFIDYTPAEVEELMREAEGWEPPELDFDSNERLTYL